MQWEDNGLKEWMMTRDRLREDDRGHFEEQWWPMGMDPDIEHVYDAGWNAGYVAHPAFPSKDSLDEAHDKSLYAAEVNDSGLVGASFNAGWDAAVYYIKHRNVG